MRGSVRLMTWCRFKGFDEGAEKSVGGCFDTTFIPHAADCPIDRINFRGFVLKNILQHGGMMLRRGGVIYGTE